ILKDTFLQLPPTGHLSPGANYTPFYQAWNLVAEGEKPGLFLTFLSVFNTLNAVLTLNFDQFFDSMRHLILPSIAVGTIPLAIIARMTRASLLDALGQDYTRTARAKGLSERRVVLKHAVRNSLLPV